MNINNGIGYTVEQGEFIDLSKYQGVTTIYGGSGVDIIAGDNNNNLLSGGNGNDQLWGGIIGTCGMDTLVGGNGADIYWFGHGTKDTVILADSTNNLDKINFYNVKPSELSFLQSGNDLICKLNTGEQLFVQGWYAPGNENNRIMSADFEPAPHQFNIQLDYSLDSTGFYTQGRKDAFQRAANEWASIIADDFAPVVAGTSAIWYDYSTPHTLTTNDTIDDFKIFATTFIGNDDARSRTIQQCSDPTLLNRIKNKDTYQPFISDIEFNQNGKQQNGTRIPQTDRDIYLTALHEIGHVLGIGQGTAFEDHRIQNNGKYYFVGENAMKVYGGAVPMFDSCHIDGNFGMLSVTAYPSDNFYNNRQITNLDKAILQDMGYHVK